MKKALVGIGIALVALAALFAGPKVMQRLRVREIPARVVPGGPVMSERYMRRYTEAGIPELQPVVIENEAVAPDENGAAQDEPVAVFGSVSGRVTDREDAPIADATLDLAVGERVRVGGKTEGAYSAKTDATGAYRIEDITVSGGAFFFASAPGYCGVFSPLRSIGEGVDYENIDFRLAPAVGRIAGRVVDQGRAAIPQARVIVAKQLGEESSQGWYVALTDELGRFAIGLPEEGEVVLQVSKEGYGTERFADIWPGMEALELVLQGAGAIAGRITNKQGAARPELTVFVYGEMSPGYVHNPWESCGDFTATTDAEGAYRVDGLSAAYTYTLRVPFVAPVGPEPSDVPENPRTFSEYLLKLEADNRKMQGMLVTMGGPGDELAKQSNVEVRAGQTTTVDFVLEDTEVLPAEIYGCVTDPTTRKPVPAIYVGAQCIDGLRPIEASYLDYVNTMTGQDGTYRLILATLGGRRTIQVYSPYSGGNHVVAEFEFEPGMRRELNFTMPQRVTAPVRVVTAEGEPVEGAFVGNLQTDSEGRTTVWGLAPYATHVLGAVVLVRDRRGIPSTNRFLGNSAPFSGKPGETVPEVVIVCSDERGRLVGQIAYPPELEADERSSIAYDLFYEGGTTCGQLRDMPPDGRFTIDDATADVCNVCVRIRSVRLMLDYEAVFMDVEIVPGETVDLGLITMDVSPIGAYRE